MRQVCRSAVFLALLTTALMATGQARFDFDATPGRLPKAVVPSHYALELQLDPDRDDFTGTLSISVTVREPVAAIVLNAVELEAVTARLASTAPSRELRVVADAAAQTWRLAPLDAAPIAAGRYRIEMKYAGKVHRAPEGLYSVRYTDAKGTARMLATQLEAVFARTVFPGFDEPSFRAQFEITVRAPAGDDVVSNMPTRVVESGEHGTRVHHFEKTPPMPSYLVSVAVGRFDVLEGESAGVPLRILTAIGKREQARYGMELTKKVLPFYGSYFGLAYALPKLDQLAVPSTRQGAMEDWGLISYVDSLVLLDSAASGPDTERWVFGTMAHEIAHQWFGNLVTAASWEEIWLNEAFASWMQEKADTTFHPEWNFNLRRRSTLEYTMDRDAGDATRAIRSGAVEESRFFEVFDEITYRKGAAVLGMIEHWLSPEIFRRGLVDYMSDRKYSNATAGDLWGAMSRASHLDVGAMASTWTDQKGFPVVRVSTTCIDGSTRATFSQARFMTAGSPPPTLWWIPIDVLHGLQTSNVLLDRREKTVTLPGCPSTPLVANAGGAGFYRVAYEEAHFRALAGGFAGLAPPDRIVLLSDAFALAQAGQGSIASYLELLAALPRVHDASRPALFGLADVQLQFLDHALAGTPTQSTLRAAGRALFAPELSRLGWNPRDGDDSEARSLRGRLIERLAQYDDTDVIAHAGRLFEDDRSGRARLSASVRTGVIRAAGVGSDRARFDQLMAGLRSASGEEERWLYAGALASGRDEARAKELLQSSLEGLVPPNILLQMPGMIAYRSPLGDLAYRFAVEHWTDIARLTGTGGFGGKNALLPDAAESFNELDRASALLADQARTAGPDGAALARSAATRIALLAAVRRQQEPVLREALKGWRPAE